jgi:hypothetical protein
VALEQPQQGDAQNSMLNALRGTSFVATAHP